MLDKKIPQLLLLLLFLQFENQLSILRQVSSPQYRRGHFDYLEIGYRPRDYRIPYVKIDASIVVGSSPEAMILTGCIVCCKFVIAI